MDHYEENPKYLKRKVKTGVVSLDYDLCDLILTYDVEATVVGDTGKAMRTERKTHRMPMKVRLDEHTDTLAYAEQLVHSTDLIPDSKVNHVHGLLESLKQYVMEQNRRSDSHSRVKRDMRKRRESGEVADMSSRRRSNEKKSNEAKVVEELGSARVEDMDEYMERLYEDDVSGKIIGTSMILQLAREAGNLEDMHENEALMGALSRTLKEDCKRSMELVCNIMEIFFLFSNFSQFHEALLGYQVGINTMHVIKWELNRYMARVEEMQLLREVADAQARGETPRNDPRKARKQGEPVDIGREEAKTASLLRKQDKLLISCVHVLLNLAEDSRVERKMAKHELVEDLVQIIGERNSTNTELLVITMAFLKKLSITRENKDEMVELDVVRHLAKYVPCSNEMLTKLTMRTLFNLSFDASIRQQMVDSGFVEKLAECLGEKHLRALCLKILYNLSMDAKTRTLFTLTEVIPLVQRLIVDFPAATIPMELAGLAVNLTWDPEVCRMMSKHSGIKHFCDRAIKRKDPLLLKMLKNMSRWTLAQQEQEADSPNNKADNNPDIPTPKPYKTPWINFVNPLAELMRTTNSPEIMIEIIGIFSHMTPADLTGNRPGTDCADFLEENELMEFIHKHLLPGFSEDDILLAIIMFIGALAVDESAARMLSNSPILKLVYDVMQAKRKDTQIVIQTLFAFHRILQHHDAGQCLLYETQMPQDLCDLLSHKSRVISTLADCVLDLVIDHDEANERAMVINQRMARRAIREQQEGKHADDDDDSSEDDFSELRGILSKTIRDTRFGIHNREWLEIVEQDELDDLEDEEPQYNRQHDHMDVPTSVDDQFNYDFSPSMISHSSDDDDYGY